MLNRMRDHNGAQEPFLGSPKLLNLFFVCEFKIDEFKCVKSKRKMSIIVSYSCSNIK